MALRPRTKGHRLIRHSRATFSIFEAGSIDEAAEVAKLHPGAYLCHMMTGGIEVRPIDQIEQF